MNYYNEIDPFAATWLQELINYGALPPGDVDTRSIEDVTPNEIKDYTQCHFFAGIGGWSYALKLAGWPTDRPVWTGSCPCQPFSSAGKGGGITNERHLWPVLFHLIEQCRPVQFFGEQVASKQGLGWFDLVQTDMEGAGYSGGSVDLCAASVGAPHIRQRLWLAYSQLSKRSHSAAGICDHEKSAGRQQNSNTITRCCGVSGLAYTNGTGSQSRREATEATGHRDTAVSNGRTDQNTCWYRADWLEFTDGKQRPVEPGTFPLADGISNRVGRLRGYGNAIVPQVAAEIIKVFL